jgi:hypothetical protein
VGPPYAAIMSTKRCSAPWCFIVTDLPSNVANRLIQRQFWPTPTITFFAIPYSPPPFEYVCTIENLTFKEEAATKVAQVIRATLQQSDQARTSVTRDNPTQNAFDAMLNSLTVKPLHVSRANNLGGGTKLLWNVYAPPPSTAAAKNREWRRIMASLRFLTALNGVGVTSSQPINCSGCKSIDHPRGLCPFPQMNDWIPITLPQNPEAIIPTVNQTPRG